MSLFDLQDVCIVIGSLATLDLPMVVDLIEIYVLKRPYCGLKNCFHIIILNFGNCVDRSDRIGDRDYDEATPPHPLLHTSSPPTAPSAAGRRPPPSSPDFHVVGLVSITSTRRFRSCQNSSALLVQTDEVLVSPVVDLIKEDLPPPTLMCQIPCESGRSQAPRRQQGRIPLQEFTAAYKITQSQQLQL
ncbi:hypothetical protein F511_02731 [Dorcoceras hygrometricum]|uniref:Uncharacterized protein n=1 Tax=Dorcoceras hygrometricum TaxID=472368 RepID=A0A2Z7AF90_9LAMI|nr:hypothetical protein F511_02731 [Dorcoceras hygrometricum]